MVSRSGEIPALEGGSSEGMLGGMSLPIGMARRALSYDDSLEQPMSPPPHDLNITNLWRRPVIPDRKFARLAEEDEREATAIRSSAADTVRPTAMGPSVVKAKASSVIMSSLITKQTHESIQRFEQQAGLTDAGYTPHKGLSAEDTRYHRLTESMHRLQMQSGELREERLPSSGQSTPSTTPQASPKTTRRGWFSQGSAASLSSSEMSSSSSSVDLGAEGATVERWSAFGPRPGVHKSTTDPGGFALQAYKGAQKPSAVELMRAQTTRMSDDPAQSFAPKMEIPAMESKRQMTRPHKLKPRDMNVLTPSGF